MARKATKANKLDVAKLEAQDIRCPTEAQMKRDSYELETQIAADGSGHTKRVKKVRQLEAMYAAGALSDLHFRSLKHYRHHAEIADRSLIRDSLTNWMPKGSAGDGLSHTVLHALRETSAIENAVGSLLDILRAVAVEDANLSQWAMHKYGAIEERYMRGLKAVVQLKPRRKALLLAQMEFRMAAVRVDAHISAID